MSSSPSKTPGLQPTDGGSQVVSPQDASMPDGGIQTGGNAAAGPAVGAQVVSSQDTSMPDGGSQTSANTAAPPAVGGQSNKRKRSDEPTSEEAATTATNSGVTSATPETASPSQMYTDSRNKVLHLLVAACALLGYIKEREAQLLRGFVIGFYSRQDYLVVVNCLDDLSDSMRVNRPASSTFPLQPIFRNGMVKALLGGDFYSKVRYASLLLRHALQILQVFDGTKANDLRSIMGDCQMW
ncbi:hypothetical protein LTR37_015758 [Vermiconidia calcicola]|uniref:Uncharacterized protein n=1 Tax=Vermiconidia calcicola TaxID=1690605 RepID=A0ACC3MQX8_9PEZI|nr:hypothetical protein LTR37_015758 [Vermiconidia calcicola]